MQLDWQDHAVIGGVIVVARAGGFALTVRLFRKNLVYGQTMVLAMSGRIAWLTGLVIALLTKLGIEYEPAPPIPSITPPPTSVGWGELAKEVSGSHQTTTPTPPWNKRG